MSTSVTANFAEFNDQQVRALLAQMSAGERAAMDRFYILVQESVYRLARAVTLSDDAAADILLELMFECWQDPLGLHAAAAPVDTLLARAYERCIASAQPVATPVPERSDVDEPGDLASWIKRLPIRQRAGLHLAFHDDLSDARIARVLGLSEAEIRISLGEALTRLVAELGGDVGVDAGDLRARWRERHRFLLRFRYALQHPREPAPGDFVLDLLNRRIDAQQRSGLWPAIGRRLRLVRRAPSG